jgi:hypothetical protein
MPRPLQRVRLVVPISIYRIFSIGASTRAAEIASLS